MSNLITSRTFKLLRKDDSSISSEGKGPELLKRIKGIRACLSNILKLEPVGEQGYRLLKTLEANSAEGEATTLLSVGGNSSLAMPLVASLPAVKDKEGENGDPTLLGNEPQRPDVSMTQIQLGSFVPPPQKKQPNLEGKQWNLETDEEHQELLAQDLNPERVKRHRRLLTRGQHEKFASEANAIQMLTAESLPLINPEQTEHQRRPVTHGQHEQVGIGTNAMPVLTSSPLTNREQRGWYRKPRTHRPRLSLSEATVSTLSSALQIRVVSQDIAQRQPSPVLLQMHRPLSSNAELPGQNCGRGPASDRRVTRQSGYEQREKQKPIRFGRPPKLEMDGGEQSASS
ncbi:hypothetical protein CDL15_Pgr012463 [Punica granatum]|uniref:Uncharacterized protein n=1 Tax=Punica granatum TaxID=22663 RepID=A0A218WZU5_PUNGR|nr:hypothetical protein CDL15_Pgr012463 [Punica granatum]